MKTDMRTNYANVIFRDKLMFAIDSWGGTSKTNINKIQTILDRVAKNVLGPDYEWKSSNQRLKHFNWLNIEKGIEYNTQV